MAYAKPLTLSRDLNLPKMLYTSMKNTPHNAVMGPMVKLWRTIKTEGVTRVSIGGKSISTPSTLASVKYAVIDETVAGMKASKAKSC